MFTELQLAQLKDNQRIAAGEPLPLRKRMKRQCIAEVKIDGWMRATPGWEPEYRRCKRKAKAGTRGYCEQHAKIAAQPKENQR